MIEIFQVFSGSDPRDRTTTISSATKNYRLCGSELPPAMSSSGSIMTVVMVSDSTVSSRGFRARWDSDQDADCGGHLTNSGVISPPVSNGNYTNHTWCKWTYDNTGAGTLVFNAPNYYIEDAYNDYCRFDWFQVSGSGGDTDFSYPRQCGRSATI